MTFYPGDMGYYGEPPEYGQFAEPPYLSEYYPYGEVDPYGSYAQVPELLGWGPPYAYGEVEPGYGQYEPMGYFAEEYPLASYGDEYPLGNYAEDYLTAGYGAEYPVGAYAEDYPYQSLGEFLPVEGYHEMPEMVGYGQYEPFAEEYPGMMHYGEPDIAGYVRDTPPIFNAGCPMPTNVAGVGEVQPLEGYVAPMEVSPSCEHFTPQPGPTPSVPETFRPLW